MKISVIGLYAKLILSVYMFSIYGHSFQRLWVRLGTRPPFNLRKVIFAEKPRDARAPCRARHVEAAAISVVQRAAQQMWCLGRQGTSLRAVWTTQRPVDSTRCVCVCVCWHAGPTPHSLLQNLFHPDISPSDISSSHFGN